MAKVTHHLMQAKALLLLQAAWFAAACSQPPPPAPQAASCPEAPAQLGQFITLPEGAFTFGASPEYPEEGPSMTLHVARFELLAHEVTNAEFAEFVAATGYVTDAERGVVEGREGAGSAVFGPSAPGAMPTWRLDPAASWRTPEGEGSNLDGRERAPVVHVSYNDAQAYALWRGARLPTEVELEYAASLGLPDRGRADSGAYDSDGGARANTWQGLFPVVNTAEDGFEGAAPVGCFGPDQIGAYDLIGNVWEWTDTPFAPGQNTLKGGSFLCAESFCRRYRPSARQPQDLDFSTNHTGFRLARDVEEG